MFKKGLLFFLEHPVEQKVLNNLSDPWTIVEWNKSDYQIQNLSGSASKKHLIKRIRPPSNSVLNIHNPIGQKCITRLRLGLCH